MTVFWSILVASFVSGVLSLFGGIALLGRDRWVKKFSIHFISFAIGALLAVSFLDLLPDALEKSTNNESILAVVLVGFVASFLFERALLRFHSPHHGETTGHRHSTPQLLLMGDSIHNFIDGVAVAAAFLVSPHLGIATALGVGVHEVPQEIGNFSIMIHHGWPKAKILWLNIFVSLTNVLGAILTYLFRERLDFILAPLLAITAGNFIYLAAADLIPELSSETSSDRTSHIFALITLGIVLVWILRKLIGE